MNPEPFSVIEGKDRKRKTGRDKLCVELLVLQETDRHHQSCWMVCRNWNIEDMIQLDCLFVMARLWHRSSRQKAVCPTLIEKTDAGNALKGTCGIGHTRWATHGSRVRPMHIRMCLRGSREGRLRAFHDERNP